MSKVRIMTSKIYILVIVTLVFCAININNFVFATSGLSVTGPSIVVYGQDIIFTVRYDSNVSFISLSDGDIVLNGFSASSKTVSGSGNVRYVKLSNVRGSGSSNSITIAAGTGYINSVTKTSAVTSNTFKIKTQSDIDNESTRPAPPSNNNQNNNIIQKPTTPPVDNTTNNNVSTPNTEESKDNNVEKENQEENNNENNETENQNNEDKKEEESSEVTEEIVPNPNTGKIL